jgi:nicotinamide mononucleotide transporter
MFHTIHEYLTEPYRTYSSLKIVLELIAAISGVLSVIFAIRKNILVYPVGIISTVLYTYLLYDWELYGDMAINAYYTAMSIYGWSMWNNTQKSSGDLKIEMISNLEWRTVGFLFFGSWIAVFLVYWLRFSEVGLIPAINYLDTTATSIFICAMFLMARMKIENWIFWIIGNTIAIPLFLLKGYGITSLQYVVFLVLAILGYREWDRKVLNTT